MSASAIYTGSVRHRRFAPAAHAFTYDLFMMYLDLSELPSLFKGRLLWSGDRPSFAWFRRRDHLGDPRIPLDAAVRDLVESTGAARPDGPIGLLTNLRYGGHCFNPISLYYCWNRDSPIIAAMVVEVHNTPWGERRAYVLPRTDDIGSAGHSRFRFDKELHVSPLLPMSLQYDLRSTIPGDRLAVHINVDQSDIRVFDATLVLRRRPIHARNLAYVLVRYPLMTVQVVARIHWQALRLWAKGVPFHRRPRGPRRID